VPHIRFVRTRSWRASNISISEARDGLAELVNCVAYARERVRLVRRGRALAAVVPIEDVELLEALEDGLDLEAAREAIADPANAERVRWKEIRERLAR